MEFELKLDSTSTVPLYLQVKWLIKTAIQEGKFEHGVRLPPMRRLGKQNSISSVTIARAYWQLEKEGFASREKGLGYFVLKR